MRRQLPSTLSFALLVCLVVLIGVARSQAASSSASFTRLERLPSPKIVSGAEAYPGGNFEPGNLLDGKVNTEYSSNAKGTNTFVELDFGTPVRIAAFRHVDRNDPATVAESELVFMDATNRVVSAAPVTHVNRPGGVTLYVLSSPVTAQRVRWRVTALGTGYSTVGGSELGFFTTGQTDAAPTAVTISATMLQMLERQGTATTQPIKVSIEYPYAEAFDARLELDGMEARPLHLSPGTHNLVLAIPSVSGEKQLQLKLTQGNRTISARTILAKPVRPMQIYLLPHSHVDIGYTALQAEVEVKQNSNIETGLRLAQATAGYPEGARFKWNVEVLWPVDNYLRDSAPEKRAAFIAAVKSGQIGLDAFYGNILTGLCRPEELLNLMSYAARLSDVCGVPIQSAMISDVPGYTWSTISAMAQAGVKYFSFAPNYFDRMGGTMNEWQNRPFWWNAADGKHRVLCWCPSRGYALGHIIGDGEALARFLPDYLVELETNSYPYDITHLRWNVHGDNGSPDEKLADVVRDWNAKYVYPKLIISTTAEAFRGFERRYGHLLPEYSGDYTPYWEDGAASSARETGMNRASAERLVQAETLWAMRNRMPFPVREFQDTWRNILLYSEHTWGAHNSISQPDLPFVRDQWKVKQGFALDADKESKELLRRILQPDEELRADAVDIFNTSSWERTDLVTLPPELSSAGDKVVDERGEAMASQRLSTGELVFVAKRVSAFGAKRFRIGAGRCPVASAASAGTNRLNSSEYFVRVDEQSGAIKNIYSRNIGRELVDAQAETAANDFYYLPGSDLKGLERNGKPHITIKEKGPLVAALVIECDAPGCKNLIREVRLVDGLDRVEIINVIDKLPVRKKEGIHFGFGFHIPDGQMRMDVGWAAVRPELDQIPAACKNWFSVQRWLDISNEKFGITWSPLDAPLVEVGGLTANLVGSQTDYRVWVQHLQPSQTIYSWVMNNHWHTNYRADQEGPTVFRYAIRAHGPFAADEAARFGAAFSQPLLLAPASGTTLARPRLELSTDKVLVSALKPSDDGKGWIVRLFGASGKAQKVKLSWPGRAPRKVWLSDISEQPRQEAGGSVQVPAWGIVTLRAE